MKHSQAPRIKSRFTSCSLLTLLYLFAHWTAARGADDLPLHGDSVFRFASEGEARRILGEHDRFIASLSRFDRQSRVETVRDVSEEEFLRFVQSHAQPWMPDEIVKITPVVNRLSKKIADFQLSLPKTVWLVQTTGREEGGAAYCRGNAIVLPHNKIGDPDQQLEKLLTHELFHILSSHNPVWRYELYRIIGFQRCASIELPESLKNRKITNPDAPELDAYITLEVDGENVFAVPVLFAKSAQFDSKLGGPFFRYLTFRLMVVDQAAGKWQPVLDSGQPRLLQPQELPDFKGQIGSNTQYIIHPDEILADNFVHVVHNTPSLPSPEIIAALRKALSKN